MDSNKENIEVNESYKDNSGDLNVESNQTQLKLSTLEVAYLVAGCESQFQALNSILSKEPSLVNMKNPMCGGYTALHFACKFGKTDVVRSLVGNYKADINIVSHSGKTPLHVAAEFKKEEVARLLVSQYGANKSVRDYSGRLAADLLPAEGCDELMKVVGPATSVSLIKPTKVPTPALSSVKRSFQSLTSGVSLDVARGMSLFRKPSEASPHTGHQLNLLAPGMYSKENSTSAPQLNLKKSLSVLTNRSSMKRVPTSRAHKDEDIFKE